MLYHFVFALPPLVVRLPLSYVRTYAVSHLPLRFVRRRVERDLFWFPGFAEGETGEPKKRNSTALPPSAPLRACPVRLRSGQALSVVEGVNSGENDLAIGDRVLRVYDQSMRNIQVETVL